MLVLSQYVEESYAIELLADSAEGVGYLLKDRVADVDRVRRRGAAGRRRRLGARPRGRLAAARPRAGATTRSTELTPREREVLGLMAEGRSNHAIAEELVVTERAVEKHVTEHLRQARPAPAPRTTTAGCSRCWPTCAPEKRSGLRAGRWLAGP